MFRKQRNCQQTPSTYSFHFLTIRQSTAILIALLVSLLTGCGSSHTITLGSASTLSTANVQRAVDRLIADCNCKTGGTITVIGVRETGGGNAIADVQFQEFQDRLQNTLGHNCTGMGQAEITHYTDGRTVLTKLTWCNSNYLTASVPL